MSENYNYCMGCGKMTERINLDEEQKENCMCDEYPKCENQPIRKKRGKTKRYSINPKLYRMKEDKTKTLSDKMIEGLTGCYGYHNFCLKEDIKIAIKLLKKEVENELQTNISINKTWRAIDKIFGNKLTK